MTSAEAKKAEVTSTDSEREFSPLSNIRLTGANLVPELLLVARVQYLHIILQKECRNPRCQIKKRY